MATFPIPGYRQKVDPHWGSDRGGADLFAPSGTPIVAVASGTVEYAGYSDVGGYNAQIVDSRGIRYYYAHLQDLFLQKGQVVAEGTGIGTVGDTGNAKGTGAHLHIGIGPSIQSGTGPAGGVGKGFDAVQFLNNLLGRSTVAVDTSGTGPPPAIDDPNFPYPPADPNAIPGVIPGTAPTTVEVPAESDPIRAVAASITQTANALTSTLTPIGEFVTSVQPGGSVWQGLEVLLWKLIATVILLVVGLVGLIRVTGADPVAIATRGAVSSNG